ncbi:MAG: class I SAM-dependent methyltransferase [Minisyncoccia bacterium]
MAEMFNPKIVVAQLNIPSGAVVADFGCGSGYFTLELAQAVGPKGKVFAIDVVPEQLESVRSLAQMRGLSDIIETRWANLEKTSTLEKESCDWVIAANLFFQISNDLKESVLKEAANILKNGGKIAIIDWKKDSVIGPPKEQRFDKEEIIQLAARQKLKLFKEINLGDTHWCVVLIK